ncbi:hypothetical protein Tco_1156000 [Tanacetum coccineum]
MSSFRVMEGKFLGHMDKKEIRQVVNIGHSKRRRDSDVMSTTKDGDNKFCTTDRERRNLDICFLCKLTFTRNGDMLHPNGKWIQALIHTIRSLRTIFIKHKVKVVIDGPIEEILKLSRKEGRLAKWAIEIRTYDISYIPRKEAKGLVMKKFFVQGEHVEGTPDVKEGGAFTLSKKLQAKSTPTSRAWRLYIGRETIEEGLGVGIILVSLEEKMNSYAIRLKFHASYHVMDYEALLAGLPASTNQGLATIKLEFLNQEVSVGIKTRPGVEETSSNKKGKAASNAPRAEPNYNREASGSNRMNL